MTTIYEQNGITVWVTGVYALFKTHREDTISFVPDNRHKRLIELCQSDLDMRTVTLTTEEGVAFARH